MKLFIKYKFVLLILFLFLILSPQLVHASYSLYFDGADYVDASNIPWVTGSSITIETWVYPRNDCSNGGGWIVAKFDDWTGQASYGLMITANCQVVFQGLGFVSSKGLVAGQWNYLVATYNGAVVKMYFDNVEDINLSSTAIIPNSPAIVTVGAKSNLTEFFTGYIDTVSVWSSVLSKTQISNRYKLGVGGVLDYSGALYAYDFEEASGTIAYDKTPNGYYGVIHGAEYVDVETRQPAVPTDTSLLTQIQADVQVIKEQLTSSSSMDWNKSMSFLAGLLTSMSVVAAARMRL